MGTKKRCQLCSKPASKQENLSTVKVLLQNSKIAIGNKTDSSKAERTNRTAKTNSIHRNITSHTRKLLMKLQKLPKNRKNWLRFKSYSRTFRNWTVKMAKSMPKTSSIH